MKNLTFVVILLLILSSCSSNDEDFQISIQDVVKKTDLTFSIQSYQPELIIFSGSIYSVIKNNSEVDFKVTKLEAIAKNGDILYTDTLNKTVSKNGGTSQGGKYFIYALYDVTFKWTIEYNNQEKTVQHVFTK